jgi:hypothetical protein
MRAVSLVLIAACALALGSCWQGKGSLYGDAKAVTPFRAGKVISVSADQAGGTSRSVLTLAGTTYRLVNDDKGTSDFGDAFVLRFFALAGLPGDTFVFEAASDDTCKPGETCHPLTAQSDRYYGLARVTRTGAQVTSPDCDKGSVVAKQPGVKIDDYGTCTFASRAALETALLAQGKRPWKTSLTYTYRK